MRSTMGAALCLVSATCFGLAPIFARQAGAAGLDVTTMLAGRFTLAALAFWALAAWRRPARMPLRTLLVCVGLGAVGYACQAACYFSALTLISASLTALLLYAYPALVTIIAVALRRETLDRRRAAALGCSALGLLLLLGTGGSGNPLGVLLGLGAAVTYALYLTVADGLPADLDLYLLSAVVCTGAAVSLLVISGFPAPPARADAWLWTGLLALVSTVIPIVTMFAGIRVVGASTAAILSSAEPAVTVASTVLLYGERLNAGRLAGGAAVLATVFILRPRTKTARETSTGTRTSPAHAKATAETQSAA